MTEKYILVSDEEYCYTLNTQSEHYKTLEDFEKQEFENAKKDNVDIKEHEEEILELANDKYWDWVYNSHLEADTVNDIMNQLAEENEQLKQFPVKLDNRIQKLEESLKALKEMETDDLNSQAVEDVAIVIGMSLNALMEFRKELKGDVE